MAVTGIKCNYCYQAVAALLCRRKSGFPSGLEDRDIFAHALAVQGLLYYLDVAACKALFTDMAKLSPTGSRVLATMVTEVIGGSGQSLHFGFMQVSNCIAHLRSARPYSAPA